MKGHKMSETEKAMMYAKAHKGKKKGKKKYDGKKFKEVVEKMKEMK